MDLSDYLKQLWSDRGTESYETCLVNHCTDAGHYCGVYAYIGEDMALLDICLSGCFQGCSRPHAAVMLPWSGSQADLEKEVQDQCAVA